MTDSLARFSVVVRGRVQGVGYRDHAARAARKLGVTGWVRNMPGGTVHVTASGQRAALLQFEQELRRGPASAFVESFDLDWSAGPEEGARSFEIRR